MTPKAELKVIYMHVTKSEISSQYQSDNSCNGCNRRGRGTVMGEGLRENWLGVLMSLTHPHLAGYVPIPTRRVAAKQLRPRILQP
jgi:hypothetical protein